MKDPSTHLSRNAPAPPPPHGARVEWSELPARVRAALEAWLGTPVASAATQPAGFSPGVAARLQLRDGRRFFVKAAGPEPNPTTAGVHRREAAIVRGMPPDAPVPRLHWCYDEGEGGWVLLLFEDVEGRHPAQPWRDDELDRVLDALVALGNRLTPSPIAARCAGEMLDREVSGWRLLQSEPHPGLDPWSRRHLDTLGGFEANAPGAVAGTTLLHFDLRADNLLLTSDRVFVVDWPHACVGAAWLDVVAFAPSVHMQGGPDPETLLQRHPAISTADPDAVTAAIAAIAGFFTHRALQPPPPGLPTLRAFQAAQGEVARQWLAQRTSLV